MPEVKRPVQTIEVNYICDKCGYGTMEKVADMNPDTGEIKHQCVICGHPQTFKGRPYPRIDHIGLDESIETSDD